MKARPYVPERGTLTSRTRRWLNVQARQALAEIDRLRAAVDADFSVITELNARKELTCRWVCNRCGSEVDPRAVRAHVITHAHEEIGLATASHNQGDPE